MSLTELELQGFTLFSLLRSLFRLLNLVVTGDFKSSPEADDEAAGFSLGTSITKTPSFDDDDEGEGRTLAEPPSSSKQAFPELT